LRICLVLPEGQKLRANARLLLSILQKYAVQIFVKLLSVKTCES